MSKKIITSLIELKEIGLLSTSAPMAPSGRALLYLKNNQLFYKINEIETPIESGSVGITSLNSLTASSQSFAAGSTGTDFNIVSSGTTHTFNLPDASDTARGVVTTSAQTFGGLKTFLEAINVPNGVIYRGASRLVWLSPTDNFGAGNDILSITATGNNNIALGVSLLTNLSAGYENIVVGNVSANALTDGSFNILLGNQLATNLTTGSANIIIGNVSATNLSIGDSNIMIGNQCGINVTDGLQNIFIGNNSALNLLNGVDNIVIGRQAGYNLTNNVSNVIIGPQAAYNVGSGDSNVIIGPDTLFNAINSFNNVIIGNGTAYNMTNGQWNVIIGDNTAPSLLIGDNNVFLGRDSGLNLNNGNNNFMVFGICAAVGTFNDVIAIGRASRVFSDSGIAIGAQANASKPNVFGEIGIAIGVNAGNNMTSAAEGHLLIGYSAGFNITGGVNNLIIGHSAGYYTATASDIILIGRRAGYQGAGNQSIYIGHESGANATSFSANNIAIGHGAGSSLSNTIENIIIGNSADIPSNLPANVVIGYAAFGRGQEGVIIGHNAAAHVYGVSIGAYAGQNIISGQRNVFVGHSAGRNLTTGAQNVAIGYEAGVGGTTSANNTFVGYRAAHNITTGSNNIVLGHNIALPTPTTSNYLSIGNFITGDASSINIAGRDLTLETIGRKLRMQEGTNAAMGTATLVAGSAIVNTTAVNANSRILLTVQSPGGTVGSPYVASILSGISFTIQSTSILDTSTVFWLIIDKV